MRVEKRLKFRDIFNLNKILILIIFSLIVLFRINFY